MESNRPTIAGFALTGALLIVALSGGSSQPASAAPQALAAAGAPQLALSQPPTTPIISTSTDTFLALVELRPTEELRQELEKVIAATSAAEGVLERGRLLQARAQTHRKLKENEIESLNVRRDLADKSKNEAEKKDLERRKKQAELEKQMLERREDLRAREIDAAKADLEWGQSARRALELELDVASHREQRAQLYGRTLTEAVSAESQRLDKEISALVKKTLEAQIESSDRRKKAAERQTELAKIRKKVFDAQQKVAAGV